MNIVAWAGYIERGETDKAFDWVTKFEEQHGLQGQRQDRQHLGRDGGADERRRVRPCDRLGRRLAAPDRGQAGAADQHRPDPVLVAPSIERLQDAPWHTVDGVHYGVPYMWGPNVLMYNTEVFKDAPPTSWNVVFEEMTLPDGKSNKGRVQAYDGPIHIADAAQYLMFHKPELGITSPYELNEDQYKAALDLLRAAARAGRPLLA